MQQDQAVSSKDSLRICIVNEFFYPDSTGGTGTVLSELARTLRQRYPEIQIDVITSRNLYRDKEARLPEAENWDGIEITRLSTPHAGGTSIVKRLAINARFGLLALKTLLSRRKSHRYDLILIGTAPPTLAMAAHALKALTGTPYLYVVYDLDPDRAVKMGVLSANHPVARVLRFAQKRWLHAAQSTIVLGRCMQEYLARTYQLPADRCSVIPIGADAGEITPQGKETRFREKHEIGGFVVAYSGNFGRYHNFDTILDAAKQLSKTHRGDVTFALSGDGAQKPHVAERIAAEAIENVKLFPFVDKADYADALASADVSLVTLEPGMEGLCVPSKFYSILASGRPVIALVSPVSEVARVVTEDRCGMQVDQGDASKLVEAISYLASNAEAAELMGKNARRTLVANYSTQKIADLYYTAMRPQRLNLTGKVFHLSAGNKSSIRNGNTTSERPIRRDRVSVGAVAAAATMISESHAHVQEEDGLGRAAV